MRVEEQAVRGLCRGLRRRLGVLEHSEKALIVRRQIRLDTGEIEQARESLQQRCDVSSSGFPATGRLLSHPWPSIEYCALCAKWAVSAARQLELVASEAAFRKRT